MSKENYLFSFQNRTFHSYLFEMLKYRVNVAEDVSNSRRSRFVVCWQTFSIIKAHLHSADMLICIDYKNGKVRNVPSWQTCTSRLTQITEICHSLLIHCRYSQPRSSRLFLSTAYQIKSSFSSPVLHWQLIVVWKHCNTCRFNGFKWHILKLLLEFAKVNYKDIRKNKIKEIINNYKRNPEVLPDHSENS